MDCLSSGVRDQPGQHSKTPTLLKYKNISWAWWHAPAVPATREAETGESLEPGRQRLQRAGIAPLHSSLGDRVRLHVKKKKTTNFSAEQMSHFFGLFKVNKLLFSTQAQDGGVGREELVGHRRKWGKKGFLHR